MQRPSGFIATGVWPVAFLFTILIPLRAQADALFVGPEFQINTYTTGSQYGLPGRSVARSTDGTFVVVWASTAGQDGSGSSIHGQRYDATGAPDGTEFQVNSFTSSFQYGPSVACAADGRFVVTWTSIGQDGNDNGVFGQRYDAAGAPDGTEFQVNTYWTGSQYRPAVSSAADGRFVVVWESYGQDGSGLSVQGQRFDATGNPDGTEFLVNTHTTGYQYVAAVASAADGRFVVVWESSGQDGIGSGVFGQRYDAAGAPDGTEFQANSYTTGSQDHPAVAVAADGGFTIVWESAGQDGSAGGIHGQRYDATGAPDGTEFQANTYTTSGQESPAVGAAADGSFLVAWESLNQDGDSEGVFAQRYDGTGATDGTEFQVNTYTTDDQFFSNSVASDGAGNFVVVWASRAQDGSIVSMFGQLLCTDADSNGSCDPRCSLTPVTGCLATGNAKLDVNEKKAGKEKVKLQWKKLANTTAQGDFGDPVAGSTAVALCVYDDADVLIQQYVVDRAGGQCAGKPCWAAKSTTGYGYKDKENASDGISKIGFKAGDADKGKADAAGKNNASKGQTALPTGVVAKLTGNTAPTIQIVTSDDFCATATMNEVKKDEATRYSAQLK